MKISIKKNLIKLFVVLLIFSSNTKKVTSQQTNDIESRMKVLDDAVFRVLYQFSQQANNRREPIVLTDTIALNIGQSWSVYYDWHRTKLDSLRKLVSTQFNELFIKSDDEELQSRLESGEKAYNSSHREPETALLYKDRTTGKIITIDNGPYETGVGLTYLQISEEITIEDWVILPDTANILNYSCQKATCTFRGRTYEAWFTTDIPTNEGPWKLYGLPGLIMKANSSDGIFCFTAIGLENLENVVIKYPDDRKINLAKDLKQLYDFRRNKRRKADIILVKNNMATAYMTTNPISLQPMEIIIAK